MKLTDEEARARLVAHDHGILCTVHPTRGADAVPVAYVVDEDGDDWTRLWWVRAELQRLASAPSRQTSLSGRLAARYRQYRDQPFARVLVLRIVAVTGWTARDG